MLQSTDAVRRLPIPRAQAKGLGPEASSQPPFDDFRRQVSYYFWGSHVKFIPEGVVFAQYQDFRVEEALSFTRVGLLQRGTDDLASGKRNSPSQSSL